MADNPFSALASDQIANPVQARMRAAERRRERSRQAEKELADEAALLKLYRRHKREQLRALLDGPFGNDVRGLMTFLRTMDLSSAPALVRLVRESPWIKALPVDQRYVLLNLVGHGITKLREKNDLPPFDDGVYGEPPKAFEQCKALLEIR